MPEAVESISLDDYRSQLESLSLNLAALSDKPLIEPKTQFVVPHHWRWEDINRVLHQSLGFQDKLPVGQDGAERRIVRLQNPGLDAETVTNTMSMSNSSASRRALVMSCTVLA